MNLKTQQYTYVKPKPAKIPVIILRKLLDFQIFIYCKPPSTTNGTIMTAAYTKLIFKAHNIVIMETSSPIITPVQRAQTGN